MAPMKSLLCISALLLSAFTLIEAQALCGFFDQSCINIVYESNGVLSANCSDEIQFVGTSSIDLNNHLGNINGVLGIGTNFTDSCPDTYSTTVTNADYQVNDQHVFSIAGNCSSSNGTPQSAAFTVGASVGNNNGALVWVNCV